MAKRDFTFTFCRPGEYRGVAPSGRTYWIVNRYHSSAYWQLRCAENEDADPCEDVLHDGPLNACRSAAQACERERVRDDQIDAAQPPEPSGERAAATCDPAVRPQQVTTRAPAPAGARPAREAQG